jgi:Reverse transcriptase (RNA-dependent DNA polymerase)
LLHHLTIDLLRESFYSLKRKAAPGVDGVTWYEYEAGLEERLIDLHGRVHRGAYRALPSRRVYIEKEDGRQRPLGVAALEDKIVQYAVATILNQIYEEDFLGYSYGFRPGRSQHDALDALSYALLKKKVNYIWGADIRGLFDTERHKSRVDDQEAQGETLLRPKCPKQKCTPRIRQEWPSIKCRHTLFVSTQDVFPPKRGPTPQFQPVRLSGRNIHSPFRNHKRRMIAVRCLYVLCHGRHRSSSFVQNRQSQLILHRASIPHYQFHLDA